MIFMIVRGFVVVVSSNYLKSEYHLYMNTLNGIMPFDTYFDMKMFHKSHAQKCLQANDMEN